VAIRTCPPIRENQWFLLFVVRLFPPESVPLATEWLQVKSLDRCTPTRNFRFVVTRSPIHEFQTEATWFIEQEGPRGRAVLQTQRPNSRSFPHDFPNCDALLDLELMIVAAPLQRLFESDDELFFELRGRLIRAE